MTKPKFTALWYKVQIKPDNAFEHSEVDPVTGTPLYKQNEHSKIVIAQSTAAKKTNDGYLAGTIVGVGPLANTDDETGKVVHDFQVGQRVLYTASNVMIVKYKHEILHFINAGFLIAQVEE